MAELSTAMLCGGYGRTSGFSCSSEGDHELRRRLGAFSFVWNCCSRPPAPADAGVRVSSSTISGNSSPIASGLGGEIGSINFPVYPSTSVILRNTIVAGNLLGPNCSFAVGSEGGNLQGDTSC